MTLHGRKAPPEEENRAGGPGFSPSTSDNPQALPGIFHEFSPRISPLVARFSLNVSPDIFVE
jgi:hypothetical protein